MCSIQAVHQNILDCLMTSFAVASRVIRAWHVSWVQINLQLYAFNFDVSYKSAFNFLKIITHLYWLLDFLSFFSSLSAYSLWLWHCLNAVCMLNYMYLDQSRCFISFHWSITSIVCTNKYFQSNNFFLSCSHFLVSSYSFHSTFSFSIVIFLLQFEYFSSTLTLWFFQSWW